MPPSTPSPQDHLTQQKMLLQQCKRELDAARTRLNYADHFFPVYMAYLDSKECYRYHNRAYREWLGLEAGQIDGHTMREVLGKTVYAEIAAPLQEALAGKPQRYARTHKTANGGTTRYFVHLVPKFGDEGNVQGIYAMVTDETGHHSAAKTKDLPPAAKSGAKPGRLDEKQNIGETSQALYDDSLVGELGEWQNAADRIKSAIQNDEFHLYGQTIKAVQNDKFALCEIYIRMIEEEENLMPPGAFLPLAQQNGLMPEIDRWVVTNVLKHIAARRQADPDWRMTGFCVNLALDTIRDPYFPDFVRATLALFNVPGEALCFEIEAWDVDAEPADAAYLVQELACLGCLSVLCSFGRDKVSFTILKKLRVGYLKIDSGIILKILRDKSALAKLVAINRVAHTVGIKTIAEFVESDAILEKLQEIGVDFAQGIGISSPMPLTQI
ncbi:Diguanylate phosphodiesterase [Georgfuchsia toluolica]|uniref:Diguanylate phosphodiesterase n=1 Tax=Georgfuchsia toluolica TaxID=424218 RepID=A0A916J1N6_9PROT|nr:EAL domain-containing protein [Georgfuchsia toluolica]CAG4882950.1 Diguanylate phosphodiesterase [Georgfuchsia toluolica]